MRELVSHVDICGKRILGIRNSKGKGPKSGVCPGCSSNLYTRLFMKHCFSSRILRKKLNVFVRGL